MERTSGTGLTGIYEHFLITTVTQFLKTPLGKWTFCRFYWQCRGYPIHRRKKFASEHSRKILGLQLCRNKKQHPNYWPKYIGTKRQWTTQKLALILRTIPTRIPSDWLYVRPQCALWPPTRRRAFMWLLANVVLLRTRPNQELTLRDFIEFVQANKYKLYQTVKLRLLVANYLCVLDMP